MSSTVREWLWNIASGGLPPDHDLEVIRKTLLLNLIVILGSFFLVIFTATAFIQQYYVLGAVDFSVFLFLLASFLFLRRTKEYNLVSTLGVVAIGCFYSFLIAHGGVGGTAFVWAFTYPLVSLFLVGAAWGSVFSLLLLGMAGTVFALGSDIAFLTSYGTNFAIRFTAAYVTVYLIALVMEQVRVMVQARVGETNRRLEESVGLLGKANNEKQDLIHDLEQSLDEISTLRGILPICAGCKKIRNDDGYWERVEQYIHDRSRAAFSHGICPDCADELYPEDDKEG
jgi:hypothetical protein